MATMQINYCGKKKTMKKKDKLNTDTQREMLVMELKILIQQNLNYCNAKSTPYLCAYKETSEGMQDIENFCIKAFFETDMDISEALIMKENLLNPNYLTD